MKTPMEILDINKEWEKGMGPALIPIFPLSGI